MAQAAVNQLVGGSNVVDLNQRRRLKVASSIPPERTFDQVMGEIDEVLHTLSGRQRMVRSFAAKLARGEVSSHTAGGSNAGNQVA